jgi:ribosomal protein L11 methylase PrmA
MLGLIDSLLSYVRKLDWSPSGTEWADYYNDTNYSDAALEEKKRIVAELVARVRPGSVWDLGANTGVFSRIAAAGGANTVAFDIDPAAVEISYREGLKQERDTILPLVMDLANPSPGIGWAHSERDSLAGRGPADLVMALALIHHLCISNNVPLGDVAKFFAGLAKNLIIEFVPKDDSQTARLFVVREDVFPEYTQEGFEAAFKRHFDISERIHVKDTKRTIYLMTSHVTR